MFKLFIEFLKKKLLRQGTKNAQCSDITYVDVTVTENKILQIIT